MPQYTVDIPTNEHPAFQRVIMRRENTKNWETGFIGMHRLGLESGWIRAIKPAFSTYFVLRAYINRKPNTKYCAPYLARLYQMGFLASSFSISEIANRTGWSAGPVCNHIEHLEAMGLVMRFPVPWREKFNQSIYILGVSRGKDIYERLDYIFFDWFTGLYGKEFVRSPEEVHELVTGGSYIEKLLGVKWRHLLELVVEELSTQEGVKGIQRMMKEIEAGYITKTSYLENQTTTV
jgi:hypothetical protein